MARLPITLLLTLVAFVSLSRAEQVVFGELMYHPLDSKPEFIEVWNITVTPLDMAKWSFTDGIALTFPDFTTTSPGAHFLRQNERIIVSSADAATTRASYPSIPVNVRIFGPWTGSLDNAGERVTLRDKNGVIVCTLDYKDQGKWPIAPDGTGHSLVLANENQAINDWRIWRTSTNNGGSPGAADPPLPAPGLAFNEFHIRTSDGHVEWVEVRNNSPSLTISAATVFLASKVDLSDKVPLSGDVTPNSVAFFNVDFAADNNGDVRLYLVDASNNVRDSVKVRRIPGRDSWQLFPPGSREWYNGVADTQNAQNDPARNIDVVINEIMADPPSNQRDGEFIELYNRGAAPVNLGGWKLDDAVNFTFPPGTTIPPGGYLVVGANSAWLNANYSGLTATGDWSGSLRNSGDRVRLEDADDNLVDQVDYRFGGEWPELAGGNGSSLELVHPDADNAVGNAWKDSDESTKSTFTSFTINGGTYGRQTQGGVTDDEIRLWLTGDSHLIIKNVVLRPTSGTGNLFVNGEVTTLSSGNVAGWQSRGTHWAGYHDAEGVHIVADGHGDNKCNHAEKDAVGMLANTAYTMTFDARWVYGKPRLVAQSWDTTWGGTVLVPIPSNLGTPGAQNSRYSASLPPQITALRHSPAVPNTTSTVTVTARVSSNTPLTNVELIHRRDTVTYNGVWTNTAMVDNGTAGDAVPADGIYTVQILLSSFAYNTNGTIVEFYVKANADNGATAWLPRASVNPEPLPSSPPRTALWVVDNQSTQTDLRRIRSVISTYWLAALNTPAPPVTSPPGQGIPSTGGGSATYNFKFPRFSNHYFPCTFIHNDSEIYYAASVRKTGSPFTRQADNNLSRGRITLPGDRPFRGHGKMYWDNDGIGVSALHNRIHRYWLYLSGVPANENEVCRVTRNNATYSVRESNEVFDKDMLDRIWDDGSDGQFYEIDDKFWMGDDGDARLGNSNGSWDYKNGDSQGAENPTAYHNNFVPKSREPEYDYGSFIEWCKQIEQNNAALTHEQIERMGDTHALTAYAAVRGYTADWDNITMSRGKNGFFYNRSTDHKWMLIHWDSDNTFQSNRVNDPVLGSLTNVNTYYNRPAVRRYLNYYLAELLGAYAANGPRIIAWTQAEEAASPSYNVPSTYATWPTTVASTGTAQTRVAVIQQFIGATSLNASFATTSPANGSNVTTDVLTVAGTAPATAFTVICAGHPEAVLNWTATSAANTSPWALSGIQLRSGPNNLVFRMLSRDAGQIGSDVNLTINKTNDALPVMSVTTNPTSLNVALGEPMQLDASGSYDPEGTPLVFEWTVTPPTGYSITTPTLAARNIVFNVPGTYTVTIQGTDGADQTAAAARVISVYAASQFDNFNGGILNGYSISNIELKDNYSPASSYSLNDKTGSLTMQINGVSTIPVRTGAPAFPLIARVVPASGDFVLQTNLSLEARQFGIFITGLYAETQESGVTTRYVFGLENGSNFKVWRASGAGTYAQQGVLPYTGGNITLRLHRTGNSLAFQQRRSGTWTSVFTQALSADGTVVTAGIFSSTGAVNSMAASPGQSLRVAFDYFLLADPTSTAGLVGSLRITEIMYNPAGAGGIEYIELTNISGAPIDLAGAYFEEGKPFSTQFTFSPLTLQPGQFCFVTNDAAGFTANYGPAHLIAGQGSGALSNDGEPVVLRDAGGNIIHDFFFSDTPPWPTTPDGSGPSLEANVIDPALYSLGTSWRASYEIEGSPGYIGLAVDVDGDGTGDTAEQAFGTDPLSPSSNPIPSTTRDVGNGHVTVGWPSLIGRTYTVKYRDDFASGTWQTLGQVTASGPMSTIIDATANEVSQRFYRVETPVP